MFFFFLANHSIQGSFEAMNMPHEVVMAQQPFYRRADPSTPPFFASLNVFFLFLLPHRPTHLPEGVTPKYPHITTEAKLGADTIEFSFFLPLSKLLFFNLPLRVDFRLIM